LGKSPESKDAASFKRRYYVGMEIEARFPHVLTPDGLEHRTKRNDEVLFLDLNLDGSSVQECIDIAAVSARMTDGANLICVSTDVLATATDKRGRQCTPYQPALKTYRVSSLPDTVFVMLLRFASADLINKPCAVNTIVDFGKYLTARPAVFQRDGVSSSSARRVLTSVIVYKGAALDGGHYVSYVKHSDGKWYVPGSHQFSRFSINKDGPIRYELDDSTSTVRAEEFVLSAVGGRKTKQRACTHVLAASAHEPMW
jgi:hypothetical protein